MTLMSQMLVFVCQCIITYNNALNKDGFYLIILVIFPSNPQANQKQRSHDRLGIFKVIARKGNR